MRGIVTLALGMILFGWVAGGASSAGESAAQEAQQRSKARSSVLALKNVKDDAKFDQAFAALDKQYSRSPMGRFMLWRTLSHDILRLDTKTARGQERLDGYLNSWEKWLDEDKAPENLRTWQRAVRLYCIGREEFLKEAPEALGKLEVVKWEVFMPEYYRGLLRWHREMARAGNVDAVKESFARFQRIAKSDNADHSEFRISFLLALVTTWEQRQPLLPREELNALMAPLALTLAEGNLKPQDWSRLLATVFRMAPENDGLQQALLQKAESAYPEDAWIALSRSRYARLKGDAAAATRFRALAAAGAAKDIPPANVAAPNAYTALVEALREEAEAALTAGNWGEAMGAARALFNVARSEKELSAALELTAKASMKNDGGMETANAFLGLLGDETTQPKEWREARPGAIWQEVLEAAAKRIEPGIDLESGREKVWLAMLMDSGAQALAAAATVYRLPDLGNRSQETTLELAAMAVRAASGSAAAAERFVKFQTGGPSSPGDKSGLPAAVAVDGAKPVAEAWAAIKALSEKDTAFGNQMSLIRDYAAWLTLSGRGSEALGVMTALYRGAVSPREIELSVAGVASVLRARDENLVRANAWRSYQRYGPAGPDGKAGTADDLADPLAEVEVKLPDGWAALWKQEAERVEARGNWAQAIRLRLMYGDIAGTAEALQKRRAGMAFQDAAWKTHLLYASAVLKAAYGHTASGQAYADYLRYGAKGKDGQAGTDDDLADPLSQLPKAAPAITTPAHAF